ncbi:hypothetical protein IAT40_006613 [Kwoniella sp. CBS 6097]
MFNATSKTFDIIMTAVDLLHHLREAVTGASASPNGPEDAKELLSQSVLSLRAGILAELLRVVGFFAKTHLADILAAVADLA